MTFRIEYAEQALQTLTRHVRSQANEGGLWYVNVHVSKFWHFHITYQVQPSGEVFTITHKHRTLKLVIENGIMIKTNGLRRFDMLFAALHEELIPKLQHGKTFKITRKKLNEQYLMNTPYFWAKIDYYLHKKETQEFLFDLFGDEKYRVRAVRIQRAMDGYIKNKRDFIEETKQKAMC